MRDRRQSLTPEERLQRSQRAKRKFRAVVRLIINNLSWLQDMEDEKLGDNVKKNIQLLTRRKGKKSLLTLADKAMLNKPAELRTEEEIHHLKRIIGNLKCFRRYPPEIKNELPGVMYFCYYGANRVIVKQGAEPINMYVIATGEVVVSVSYYDRLLKETVEKNVGLMGPGSYFGEVSLLHGISRTATVTTTVASEFLYLNKEDFDRVLKATVQNQWDEVKLNMSMFTYFKDWSEEEIRESCILAKKKYFEPDEVILSDVTGSSDCVYFVTKGMCYLLEYMVIKTTLTKGLRQYHLVEEPEKIDSKAIAELYKEIRKSYSQKKSPASSTVPEVRGHFIKVCNFNRLACFNVGESLKNRIIVAATLAECLLLPRYFLMEKSTITFKSVEHYLRLHIPSTKQIFSNFLEEKKWNVYKTELVNHITKQKKKATNNAIHNIPYSIRLKEDLSEI